MLFGVPEADFKLFVGDNAEDYLVKWRVMQAAETSTSWNWSAGLLTGYWLLYRRMYAWFFVYFIVGLFFWGLLWFLGTLVAFGLFGDWLYLQHARKKITAISSWPLDGDRYKTTLIQKGGRDWVSPLILFIFQFFFLIVLVAVGGLVTFKLLGPLDWPLIWHKMAQPGLVNT